MSLVSTANNRKISNSSSSNNNNNNNKFKSKHGTFIGGAAATRKAATRKAATPILNPMQRQRAATYESQVLSTHMAPMERFFAALFRSTPSQFVDAASSSTATSSAAAGPLMQQITQRVGLRPPAKLVPQHHYKAHVAALASLVLEEARHAVSEALLHPSPAMPVTLSSTKGTAPHDILFFRKATDFTPSQLHDIRPGTAFTIQRVGANTKLLLGTVVSNTEKSMDFEDPATTDANLRSISLMIYQAVKLTPGSEYNIAPLTGLITHVRQFEACTPSNLLKVPFLPALMGQKGATHLKFELHDEFKEEDDEEESQHGQDNNQDVISIIDSEDDDEEDDIKIKPEPNVQDVKVKPEPDIEEDEMEEHSSCMVKVKPEKTQTPKPEQTSDNFPVASDCSSSVVSETEYLDPDTFSIPILNETQEKACTTFLSSNPGSITLVQGPPGTGKTTLLGAIICRYLLQTQGKNRLMVCAPTNKAVTVLATRYLDAARGDTDFNAVMIGDKEKLLTEDQPGLRGMFAYTFMGVMVEEWTAICLTLKQKHMDVGGLITKAKFLVTKLDRQLPNITYKHDLSSPTGEILQKLVELFSCGPTVPMGITLKNALRERIEKFIKQLTRMNDRDVTAELLSSAHVIFSTLASAGAVMVKQTDPIDDLIVDEAAAATEPELYIPFHLKPQRLLAVGDPKQLPATVMSRLAEKCGLNKSLHERLMYDCKWPYIMLNVQYRMRPAISVFPSNSFYGGEIQDGPNVTAPNYNTRMSLMKNAGYQFVQVNGIESQGHTGSYQNIAEAKVVVDLLVELCNMARMQQSGRGWSAVDRIRVITFYQAQVTLIKSMLRGRGRGLDGVVVSTVDSSQGCEADVVIVTFVRSANKDGNRVGFLSDNRRLNVALTRAKFQMICVGNANGMLRLDHAPTIQALAKDAQTRDCITNYRPILTEYRADIHKRINGPGRNNNKNKRDRNQKMMKQPSGGGERENAGGNAGSKNNTGRKQRRQDKRQNSTSNEHHAKRVKQAPPH